MSDYFFENNQNYKLTERRKIFLHFKKSQKIILIYIFFIIIIKNFLSFIFFFKKFKKLDKKNINFILNILSSLKFLKTQKIEELFHALYVLVTVNNEKIFFNKSLKKNNYNDIIYDAIIVGSGPSGAVTANMLISSGIKNILIVEEGKKFNLPNLKHPGSEFYFKWKNSGLASSLGKDLIQYSSGNCVGGGSEINSGLCHDVDFEYLSLIYKNERNLRDFYDTNFLNTYLSDPLNTYLKKNYAKNFYQYFKRGISKTKWKFETLKKFSTLQNNELKKNSMSETCLKDYLMKGGNILENYKCVKINKLKKNLISLDLLNKSKKLKINCKNVFICCGAPYSLQLLKQSKLVSLSLNNNFHFHPMIKIIAKYNEEVNPSKSGDVFNTQIVQFYPKYIFGNAASGEQFLRISTYGNSDAYLDVQKSFKNMTTYHSTFSLSSSSLKYVPFLQEHIIFNKFNKNQKKIILEGVENLLKFIFYSGAEYVYLGDEKSTKILPNQIENISKILQNLNFKVSAVHLLGGLSMGNNRDDPLHIYGKLKESNYGIYINDSSLLTHHLLKNPQSTVMQVANINTKHFIKNGNF
ncbi:hypothetical protein IDG51_03225 [Pelagibacterales bacterium SAG-MED14]|nr:hypothetical protein [Pelagibacterales bacterium SAG-MED14]